MLILFKTFKIQIDHNRGTSYNLDNKQTIKSVESKFLGCITEGPCAKGAYIGFWADFHFLQYQANFWQTDCFDMKRIIP